MRTDDPGTPGDGRWEINIAALDSRSRSAADAELPLLDINYGVGDRLQLKYEVPREQARTGGVTQRRIGDSLLGVKWRFLDQTTTGWQVSTYPQIAFHRNVGATPAGIPSTLLPVEMEYSLDGVDLGIEVGRRFQPAASESAWIAGVVIGHDFGGGLELLGEYHDESSADWRRNEGTINFGMRIDVSPRYTLLASAGRDLSNTGSEVQTLIAYCGVQFHL